MLLNIEADCAMQADGSFGVKVGHHTFDINKYVIQIFRGRLLWIDKSETINKNYYTLGHDLGHFNSRLNPVPSKLETAFRMPPVYPKVLMQGYMK